MGAAPLHLWLGSAGLETECRREFRSECRAATRLANRLPNTEYRDEYREWKREEGSVREVIVMEMEMSKAGGCDGYDAMG